MAKLWAIFKREYLERVRTKWFLVSTILAPILFGALFILPVYFAMRSQPSADIASVTILDATGSGLGNRIARELNGGLFGDTTRTRVIAVAPGALAQAETTATQAVMRKATKGYLVVDSSTLAARTARYAGSNASSDRDMERLQRVIRNQVMAVRLERAGIDAGQVAALTGGSLKLNAERLTEKGRSGSGQVGSLVAFFVAFVLYMSIFLYGQNVLRGVMEEKQTRVAEVVVSSVSATTLLAGKVLGVGAVGITQLVLSGAASTAFVKARGPIMARLGLPNASFSLPHVDVGVALLLILYFVLGYLFYAALFAAIGSTVSSENEAQQVQLPVTMLLIVSGVCIQPVLMAPESTMSRVLSIVPFSAPIIMPLRLSLVPVSSLEIAASLVSLAVGCYVAIWVAARIYRTGLLMYGKRPTLGEMARWVRDAR